MFIPSTDLPTPAGPSIPSPPSHAFPPQCQICTTQPSKYTCPRCYTKSCSLPCSRAHKASTGCSGERDRAAFVPMNQYGYGALVNDYVFLEDVGRKVEDWGREIVKEGILSTTGAGAGAGMGRGRGRGRGKGMAFRQRVDRRNFLAMQLGLRDINVDVLPAGMKRAKQNHSRWDLKAKRAFLTIEFIFETPPDPLTREQSKQISVMVDKCNWELSIRQIIQANVGHSKTVKHNDALLRWLSLEDEDESIPTSVLCLMKRPRTEEDSLDINSARPSYYKLDWNTKLSKALRYKHFVEFPTILLIDESLFDGVLVDDSGIADDLRERRPKRRKFDTTEGKKTISGLVGNYGSEEEDEADVMGTLVDYSVNEESDEDVAGLDENVLLDEEGGEHDNLHAALNTAQISGDLIPEDEEDGVDWGDDEIAEDEAKLASLSAALQRVSKQ